MSISQNFPEEGPTLNLNFAGSRTLDPRITFSRSQTTSNGSTYTGPDGLIKYAGPDEPRFDHRYMNGEVESLGLLIEEQRQNLLNYSNDYSGTGGWLMSANGTRTKDLVGPDGLSNNAWTITDNDNVVDLIQFYKQISITPSTTTNYCISSFVKNISVTSPEFYVFFLGSNTKGSFVRYNFTTDTFTSFSADGGGIQPSIFGRIFYPNGWVRIYFVVNDANSGLNNALQYRIYPNGRGANTTGSMGLFGSQIEIGTFPTSYIPTESSTKTRNPDNVSMTGTNFTDWYNQSEGTLFTQYNTIGSKNNQMVAQIRSDNGDNRVEIRAQGSGSSVFRVEVIDDGATNAQEFTISPSGFTTENFHKITLGYKENDFASTINGTLYTDNSGTVGSCDYMMIGDANYSYGSPTGTGILNGHISQITYYPTRLSNSQLIALTR